MGRGQGVGRVFLFEGMETFWKWRRGLRNFACNRRKKSLPSFVL